MDLSESWEPAAFAGGNGLTVGPSQGLLSDFLQFTELSNSSETWRETNYSLEADQELPQAAMGPKALAGQLVSDWNTQGGSCILGRAKSKFTLWSYKTVVKSQPFPVRPPTTLPPQAQPHPTPPSSGLADTPNPLSLPNKALADLDSQAPSGAKALIPDWTVERSLTLQQALGCPSPPYLLWEPATYACPCHLFQPCSLLQSQAPRHSRSPCPFGGSLVRDNLSFALGTAEVFLPGYLDLWRCPRNSKF